MIITQLHKRRGSLYLLELDGEPAMTVDRKTFEESSFKVGSSLSDEALKEMLDESQKRRAKEKALYLLSLRSHSRAELERKLLREADRQTAEETAARMEELGFLNDEEYANRLANDLILRKHYPVRRAVQELCARGLERGTAQSAVQAVNSDDLQQAIELLKKKYYNKLSSPQGIQKAAAALARCGFGGDVIRRAVQEWRAMQEWHFDEQEMDIDGL